MDPITGANTALNGASRYGPDTYLAIAVLLFSAMVVFLLFSVGRQRESILVDAIANNTKALSALAPILAGVCKDLSDHDANTGVAVNEIHQLKPIVERVDARTLAMDTKIDRLLWLDEAKK